VDLENFVMGLLRTGRLMSGYGTANQPENGHWMSRRLVACVCSLAMLTVGLATTPAAAALSPQVEEAKRLFQEGRAHFEISEYPEAVASFREAYLQAEAIEDAELRDEVLVALLYNLAQARLFAYKIDRDVAQLRQAQHLIERYLVLEPSEVEREDGRKLKAEVDAELDAYQATKPAEPEVVEVAPEPEVEPVEKPIKSTAGRGFLIGGSVVTGLSAVGLGLMGFGLADGPGAQQAFLDAPDAAGRERAVARGNRANDLAIAGGVVAGALLTAGVALIVTGARRKHTRTAPQLGLQLQPSQVGISMNMQF